MARQCYRCSYWSSNDCFDDVNCRVDPIQLVPIFLCVAFILQR
uniref:Uncharacterized protein n=1 Tax=Setaria italica TaxID=4555 RepID=K3ZGF4_SETIT